MNPNTDKPVHEELAISSAIVIRGVTKRFGPLLALDNVSLTLAPGRVHGLLGENGAGKTTLMNILYGLLRPDSGEIVAGTRRLDIRTPRDAIAAGFGMVHQHFMLGGAMSVLDNVLLGDKTSRLRIDRKSAAEKLSALSREVGLPIDPRAVISDLAVGQQQRVEILKALWRGARVLILDEPTAVLTPAEVDQLFAAVERLRNQGTATVFISHKLNEVQRICDDLTVLRRGRIVWEGAAHGIAPAELARHMVGHDVSRVSLERAAIGDEEGGEQRRKAKGERRKEDGTQETTLAAAASPPLEFSTAAQKKILSDEDVAATGGDEQDKRARMNPALRARGLEMSNVRARGLFDVSLSIAPGEILGIAGVDGNGQQELAEAVVGLRHIDSGRLLLDGADASRWSFARRRNWGLAHIPNDRKREGLVGAMSIAQNIALKRFGCRPFSLAGLVRWRAIRREAQRLATQFDVRFSSIDAPVSSLSGGNQQKVILARELALAKPRLIVAMNPVRGLDVAATQFVYQHLLASRAAGAAILLISSELDELLALCDRIAVLYARRLTMSHFPRTGGEEIGRLMGGVISNHG